MEDSPLKKYSLWHFLSLVLVLIAGACFIMLWGGRDGTWRGSKIMRGSDLYQHYVAGQIVREGGASKLYHDSYLLKRELNTEKAPYVFNYVYGPLVARVAAFVMRADFNLIYNIWFLSSIACACIAAIFFVKSGITIPCIWILVLGFPAFFYSLILGQVTPFSLFFFGLAAVFVQKDKLFLSGLCLSLIFYKPQIIPYLCLFLLGTGWWRWVAGVAVGGIFWIALTVWAGGVSEFRDWVGVILGMTQGAQSQNYMLNVTWSGLFRSMGILAPWMGILGALAVFGAGTLLRARKVDKVKVFYASAAVSIPFLPYAMSYELLMILPSVMVLYQIRRGVMDVFVVVMVWAVSLLSHQFFQTKVAFSAPLLTFYAGWLVWRLCISDETVAEKKLE